jgi:hypothetical protein
MQLSEQYIGKLRRLERSSDQPLGEGTFGGEHSCFGLGLVAIQLRVLYVVQVGTARMVEGFREREYLLGLAVREAIAKLALG